MSEPTIVIEEQVYTTHNESDVEVLDFVVVVVNLGRARPRAEKQSKEKQQRGRTRKIR